MLKKLLNGHTLYMQEEDDLDGAGAPVGQLDDDTADDGDSGGNEDLAAKLAQIQKQLDDEKKAADRQQAQLRRKYERENKKLMKELEALRTTNTDDDSDDDMDDSTPDPKGKNQPDPALSKEQAQIQRALREQRRELEKLNKELQDVQARREKEEAARKALERDTIVRTAIQKAGVLPGAEEVAFDHFVKRVVWDDTYQEWAFKDGEDFLNVEEVVVERMPDYLKPRKSRSGSGSTNTGAGKTADPAAGDKLKAAKAKLKEIYEDYRAHDGRGEYSMKDYLDQKKLVQALEKGA